MRVLYLQDRSKLAGKTLSEAELLRLQKALTQARFFKLPAEMVQATCDSFDQLTVSRATVRATDVYSVAHQAEFKRFRQWVSCLRELFPPPGPGYCLVELEPGQDALVPGESIWISLRLTPLTGWHTYWLHPGESGMASEIRWKLPRVFSWERSEGGCSSNRALRLQRKIRALKGLVRSPDKALARCEKGTPFGIAVRFQGQLGGTPARPGRSPGFATAVGYFPLRLCSHRRAQGFAGGGSSIGRRGPGHRQARSLVRPGGRLLQRAL